MNLPIIFLLLVFSGLILLGAKVPEVQKAGLPKTTTNDDYNFIAINQCLMHASNNGDGSHNPITDGSGFYWPGGIEATITAIFEDGLVWGGIVDTQIRVGGSTYRHGLQAGKILANGTASDPADPANRIYKIRRDWQSLPIEQRAAYQTDYEQWPWQDGAPFVDKDGDGMYMPYVDVPEYLGDEVLWFVSNDLDSSRTRFLYGTDPMGLEVQCAIFAFKRCGDLGDMLFKKYRLINKGSNTIKDMYLAYWSDVDLGDAGDDYVGCDIDLDLSYSYNGDNNDAGSYGADPPAVGYAFLQGPIIESVGDSAKFGGDWIPDYKNLGMTAFMLYIGGGPLFQDPNLGTQEGANMMYNNMQGILSYSGPIIDPITDDTVHYAIPGDPYLGTGWYEGEGWPSGPVPGDRRHLMASGPFTMAPGDTQEVTIGIVIARAPGEGNLAAVRELKRKTRVAQSYYDIDFHITLPPKPQLSTVVGDGNITLYWEPNAEAYDTADPELVINGLEDSTYTFEGYRLWQFSDLDGGNPVLLNTNDIANGIKIIYETQSVIGVETAVPVINSPDLGLWHRLDITEDSYTRAPMRNGSTYYFGISAYAYSANSCPTYLESPPQIVTVRPGTKAIDVGYTYDQSDFISAVQTSGYGDGDLFLYVVDPEKLTGDTYAANFTGPDDDLRYTLMNTNIQDTLIKDGAIFGIDFSNQPITEGFQFVAVNTAADTLASLRRTYSVQDIMEISGPGGIELSEAVDVNNHLNSTGAWQLVGLEGAEADQDLNWTGHIGYKNYEIRFTAEGSEYYLSGYPLGFTQTAPFKDDPKANDRLPFEIWNIGFDVNTADDDVRLVCKVLDNNYQDSTAALRDSMYTQLDDSTWEQVYAYFSDSTYSEPLPDWCGRLSPSDHYIGKIVFKGNNLPAEGTVIRISTWRPLSTEDRFELVATQAVHDDYELAKSQLDKISVFPNPYFPYLAVNSLGESNYDRFVRFTNLPKQVTIRIFSLAGVFVTKLEKNDAYQWMDWNLTNSENRAVGSGVYIAHIEMPGIGSKTMKLAIIQGK